MNSHYIQLSFSRTTLACMITLGLAACGGGSNSDTGSATSPTKTQFSTNINLASTNGLKITTLSCPGGTQGSAYAGCIIRATGGTPPYTLGVKQSGLYPPLPEGITMDSVTGAISSGNIKGQGTYGTQLIVIDAVGNTATQIVDFVINGNNKFLADIFPSNSIFHHRVDAATTGLPVDRSPAAPLDSAYASSRLQPSFGNKYSYPWPYGTPAIQVPASAQMFPVTTLLYQHGFTAGPIPWDAPVQGTKYSAGDKHVIVYVQPSATSGAALYEMWKAQYASVNNNGAWTDGSNAMWSNVGVSNALTIPGTGATNAAGLPDGPLLVTADEVIGTGTPSAPNGMIRHPTRMTMPRMLNNWVWPATGTSGVGSCSSVAVHTLISQSSPPAACTVSGVPGQIYRLKAGTVLPACIAQSPQAAIIATALKNYGVILGDNSFAGNLVGTADARWNDSDLQCLSNITLSEFEPVNVSSLMISSGSGATSR